MIPTPKIHSDRAHIHLRLPLEIKAQFVRAARPKKLSEWILETLTRELKKEPCKF